MITHSNSVLLYSLHDLRRSNRISCSNPTTGDRVGPGITVTQRELTREAENVAGSGFIEASVTQCFCVPVRRA